METYDRLVEKWAPVLNEESAGVIQDSHRKAVTAAVLENQELAFAKEQSLMEAPTNTNFAVTGADQGVTGANWNPVLIALVRRAMPNLMAYELAGVQPMTGPTGLIFAMRSVYKGANGQARGGASVGDEALFDEAIVPYSGDSAVSQSGSAGPSGLAGVTDTDTDSSIVDSAGSVAEGNTAGAGYPSGLGTLPYEEGYSPAMTTRNAEKLGYSDGSAFAEMGFTIEKATVTARSRASESRILSRTCSRPQGNPRIGR